MFGQNEIVGKRFFADADKLLVTSVFYTLQGEGPFAGRPAVFVRLTHCNLQCKFCDTNFSHGDWMDHNELLGAVLAAPGDAANLASMVLVVTGGEPMLQPALVPLLVTARLHFAEVQIESNGLQLLDIPNSSHLVVSPKCSQIDGIPIHYLKPPKRVLHRANCLKFVVTADRDSPYYTVPDWALSWQQDAQRPVYVSPMAEYKRYPDLQVVADKNLAWRSRAERVSFWESDLLDMHKVRANHEHAAQLCLKHGLRLSMQLQLFTSLA